MALTQTNARMASEPAELSASLLGTRHRMRTAPLLGNPMLKLPLLEPGVGPLRHELSAAATNGVPGGVVVEPNVARVDEVVAPPEDGAPHALGEVCGDVLRSNSNLN